MRATFEKWWPDFHTQFKSIKFPDQAASKPGGTKEQNLRLEKIEGALEIIMRAMQRNEILLRRTDRGPQIPRVIRRPDGLYVRDEMGRIRKVGEEVEVEAGNLNRTIGPTGSGPTDPSSQN